MPGHHQHSKDVFAITLTDSDFISGSLPAISLIRPTRIFTADKNIIVRKAGSVKTELKNRVFQSLIELLK